MRFILIEPSRFLSIFSHNYFCFLYKQLYGEWRGGIFFTPSRGFVPSSQVTVDVQSESQSLIQLQLSGASKVLRPVLSFGRHREEAHYCWVRGKPGLYPDTAKSRSFPILTSSLREAAGLTSQRGVSLMFISVHRPNARYCF